MLKSGDFRRFDAPAASWRIANRKITRDRVRPSVAAIGVPRLFATMWPRCARLTPARGFGRSGAVGFIALGRTWSRRSLKSWDF